MTAAIERLARQGCAHALRCTQRRTDRVCPAEEPIIVAAAVAETVPFSVARERRRKNQVDVLLCNLGRRVGRLQDTVVTGLQLGFSARSCCRPCRTAARRPSCRTQARFRAPYGYQSPQQSKHSRKCSLPADRTHFAGCSVQYRDQSPAFPQRTGLPVPQDSAPAAFSYPYT